MKKELCLTDLLVSTNVYPIEQFGRTGRIHSVFRDSFNIIIKQQLLHFTRREHFIASFGVWMDAEAFVTLLDYLQVDNLIKLSERTLTIYSVKGICQLSFHQVAVNLKISPQNLRSPSRQQLAAALACFPVEDRVGLDLFKEKENLRQLTAIDEDGGALRQSVLRLIGRGLGLTPSGDDILLAYLLILQLYQAPRFNYLTQMLREKELLTTIISQTYLLDCLNGHVSLPIYRLVCALASGHSQSILRDRLLEIREIGHSSGADLLFGMQLAVKYLVRKECGGEAYE